MAIADEISTKAYQLLKEKGKLTLEDVMLEFNVKPTTAYSILRILRKLCEEDPNCTIKLENKRRILVYKKAQVQQTQQSEQQVQQVTAAQG